MTAIAKMDKPASFEQQATSVLARMGSALAEVVAVVAGEIETAVELERALGLDKKLSWRILKISRTTKPLSVGGHVPGSASIKKFMRAAARCGASPTMIESVEAVYQDFEQLVKTHAGDRNSFDSLVSAFDREAAEQMGLQQRRAAFRAQSHILGIQATTQLHCSILHPGASLEKDDFVSIRGVVGLSQTRHLRTWVISRSRVRDVDESQQYSDRIREPLDPAAQATHGVALLRGFCSEPLPEIHTFMTELGHTNTELLLDVVGKDSSVTCLLGDVWRDTIGHYQDVHNQRNEALVKVRTPVEALILDVLIYEGMFGRIKPDAIVFSDHHDTSGSIVGRESDRLEMGISVTYLGQGPAVLYTPSVPRYPEMAQYAFDRLGWDGEKFDVYRCRVEYPVMPSSVVVRFELPEKP